MMDQWGHNFKVLHQFTPAASRALNMCRTVNSPDVVILKIVPLVKGFAQGFAP